MKRFATRFLMAMALGAVIPAAASDENVHPDPEWEVMTLSDSLDLLELPYSGTGFDLWNPVDRFIIEMGYFRTDLDDFGRSEKRLFWYSRDPHFDGTDSEILKYEDEERYLTSDPVMLPVEDRYAPYAGSENLQYLAFDSSNVMYRTVLPNRPNSQHGADPYYGWNRSYVKYVEIGGGSLIFDGMVQFVGTDLDEPDGFGEDVVDDKVVIWLHAVDEEGYPSDEDYIEGRTNLVITAAFLNTFNEGNFVSNYVITCTNTPAGVPVRVDEGSFIRPHEWHHLTITAFEDISNTPRINSDNWVGFSVKLDGIELSTGIGPGLEERSVGVYTAFESLNKRAKELADRGSLFPALVGNVDHANEIFAVGFQGAGACDDLLFSEGEIPPPEEYPELTDEETAAIVNGVRYATFTEALAAAAAEGTADNPAEMQLVRDIVVGADDGSDDYGYGYLYLSRGWIVLDMNGHTLQGNPNADMPFTLWIEGAHLVIENTGDDRDPEDLVLPIAGYSDAWYRYSGEIVFDDGTPLPPSPKMLCMIGSSRYETFGAAMEAWNPEEDDEIELLGDVEETERQIVSDYVAVNLAGHVLAVDFMLSAPDTAVELYGDGDFTGEVLANVDEYAYADGWEFKADAENGCWSFGERDFPKTLDASVAYSAKNPCVIADLWDLKKLAAANATDLARSYVQTADIDLEDVDWGGIGSYGNPFTGIYDGNGHRLEHLTLAKLDDRYNGLFGALSGKVRNLTVSTDGFSTNGTASAYSAGVVAAYVTGTSSIREVTVEGTVSAFGYIAAFGGLVKGELTLRNCETKLTQSISIYSDGENLAFVAMLGKGGSLIGAGGNRANESLPITSSEGFGETRGFEVKTVVASTATYDPTAEVSPITVDGEEVDEDELFTFADSGKTIVFTETPGVITNKDSGVQIVPPGGSPIDVPSYYQVAVSGVEITLSLDEAAARPQITGDGASVTVNGDVIAIKVVNADSALYYRLVYREQLTDESWTPAGDWVRGSSSLTLRSTIETGARYYAVQVTDVPR